MYYTFTENMALNIELARKVKVTKPAPNGWHKMIKGYDDNGDSSPASIFMFFHCLTAGQALDIKLSDLF